MDFLTKLPFFSLLPPRFLGKDTRSFAHHVTHCFLIRTALRANGHAPADRALSEFEILAFTLHLHPQIVDTVRVTCEEKALFSPSSVKETGVKPSPASRCFRAFYSCMVKR